MKVTKDDKLQKRFDFNRAVQLRTLERAVILGKSSGTLKAILKALDSYQRDGVSCFPSIPTLARNCGLSARTVQRGLHRLEEIELVSIERHLHSSGSPGSNIYRINWSRLLDLASDETDIETEPPNLCQGVVTVRRGGGDMLSPPWCQDDTTYKRQHRNVQTKRTSNIGSDVALKPGREDVSPAKPAQGKLWGLDRPLTRSDLRNAAIVAAIFDFVVRRGWGCLRRTEADRLTFFALCEHVARAGKDPGKYLTTCLKGKFFGNISGPDEDAGAARLKALQSPGRPSPVVQEIAAAFRPAVEPEATFEDRRREMLRRLAEAQASAFQ